MKPLKRQINLKSSKMILSLSVICHLINNNYSQQSSIVNTKNFSINKMPVNKERIIKTRVDTIRRHLGSYLEPTKELSILDITQVLVVGGGPAGISAALASARAGCDTILIDSGSCFGGVITKVGMETIAWYRYPGTVDCKGIGTELERIAKDLIAKRYCSSPFPA